MTSCKVRLLPIDSCGTNICVFVRKVMSEWPNFPWRLMVGLMLSRCFVEMIAHVTNSIHRGHSQSIVPTGSQWFNTKAAEMLSLLLWADCSQNGVNAGRWLDAVCEVSTTYSGWAFLTLYGRVTCSVPVSVMGNILMVLIFMLHRTFAERLWSHGFHCTKQIL